MVGVEPFVPLLEGSCVFDLYMIGVEPFVPLLEGSCVLVSVVLSRCPCLWEPRLFQVGLAFVFLLMPSDFVSLPLCDFRSLG